MLDFGPHVGLKAEAGFRCLPQLCTELRHPIIDGEVWSAGPHPTPMQDHSQEGLVRVVPLKDPTGRPRANHQGAFQGLWPMRTAFHHP